ncbi:MAG: hypothetical protein PUJ57_05930 [Peptoniphilaceae bacterium]|nr:hypothetical protein [Peptoniphilaceae bacterium]MDY6085775.1 hypothetical protein [Peptoniphilaceae bacterium]
MLDATQIATLLKQIFAARPDLETSDIVGMKADDISMLYVSLAEDGVLSSEDLPGGPKPPEDAPSESITSIVCPPCGSTSGGAGQTNSGTEQQPKESETDKTGSGSAELPPAMDLGDVIGGGDLGGGYVDMGGMDLGGGAGLTDGGSASVANQPKLIVSNYSLSPQAPKAGQDFRLKLTFENTNKSKSVRNIKITLGGSETQANADALSQGQQPATMASGGGSVFTPVGSSNTFYIPRINPERTGAMEITLRTSPTVAAQAYSLNVAYEYEDKDGNQYAGNETIGIPVTQEAKVLLGDVTTQTEGQPLMPGMPTPLEMELFNIGKDSLSTFMVSIEGEGFDVSGSPRYFIGTFAPGASDRYSVEIMPTAEVAKGDIVITYEDSTGAMHEERQPFSFTVEGMGDEVVDRNSLILDEKSGFLTDGNGNFYDQTTLQPVFPEEQPSFPVVPVAVVGLIALVAVLFFWRKHKKGKDDRKELDLDA